MSLDLTKVQSTTTQPGFKNNDEYEGSFTISGSFNGQSKQVTTTITLPDNVDIADIMFKGRADGGFSISTGEARPNDAWFKRGRVYVRGDDSGAGYTNYPVGFILNASISGNQLTISANAFKTFVANLSLTSETVYYKLVDYSVF